jgi:hypothetical protein
MTPDSVGPLSRPYAVDRLPQNGADVLVKATPEECAALAQDFGLPAIRSLEGRFQLSGTPARVKAAGRITADITQICVVTLDPFDSRLEEDVDLEFEVPRERADEGGDPDHADLDRPDEIVAGQIDFGAVVAEFLALGLDPYPRKPGAEFAAGSAPEAAPDSPFAALSALKRPS